MDTVEHNSCVPTRQVLDEALDGVSISSPHDDQIRVAAIDVAFECILVVLFGEVEVVLHFCLG